VSSLYVDPTTGWELPVFGGIVTQGYGPENTDPSVRHLYRKGYHTGIDIGGVGEGTPILSPRDGTVALAEWFGGYGNTVIVDCGGGCSALFGHLSEIGVSAGQPVTRGQQLGGVGTTGVSTGVHLHYEWRRNGDDCDPMEFLRPAPPDNAIFATVKEDLNFRSGPSKNDPIIMTLPAGTKVQVGRDGWLPVWFEGRQGWMFAEFLEID
jgi:murein DD-endopeptidase MepM/ murein hydrolase activator NlpD